MRNTMTQNSGRSPAQLLYGRNLRFPLYGKGTSWVAKNIKPGWNKRCVDGTTRNYEKTVPKSTSKLEKTNKIWKRDTDRHEFMENIDMTEEPLQIDQYYVVRGDNIRTVENSQELGTVQRVCK
ncbi:hypothetical protein A3Q56_01543 [Intoshia linei]|uniref:Uncharacterized protein n=1 Tax=Intoshia linei TaxID=1819745 RepID=A0A177BB93_9BILA|nr:hypothetical protein A3Q56_01543 [Intoshia linei]